MEIRAALWRLIAVGLVFLALGYLAAKIYGKYEICTSYYKELSLPGCMVSNYGLPHRGGK